MKAWIINLCLLVALSQLIAAAQHTETGRTVETARVATIQIIYCLGKLLQ